MMSIQWNLRCGKERERLRYDDRVESEYERVSTRERDRVRVRGRERKRERDLIQ